MTVAYLRETIEPARRQLESHPLYGEIRTMAHLRLFFESHIFAVWDFMSLLKWLQGHLTGVTVPWVPSPYPQSRRLINEIVLGEESDCFEDGYTSHFELYLRAMEQAGADISAIHALLAALNRGQTVQEALIAAQPPAEAGAFVESTFAFLGSGKPHVIAAAFTFGREDLIPDMFHQVVKQMKQNRESVQLFDYYLNRHIEVDSGSHGPMSLQMVEELCGSDPRKWEEATSAAAAALHARSALWDGILRRVCSA